MGKVWDYILKNKLLCKTNATELLLYLCICPIVTFSKQAFQQNEQFMNKQYIIMNERTDNKLMFLNDLFNIQTKWDIVKQKQKQKKQRKLFSVSFVSHLKTHYNWMPTKHCVQSVSCFLLDYVQNQLCFISESCFGRLTMGGDADNGNISVGITENIFLLETGKAVTKWNGGYCIWTFTNIYQSSELIWNWRGSMRKVQILFSVLFIH